MITLPSRMFPHLKKTVNRLPLFWRLQLAGWSAYFVYGCIIRTSHYDHTAMGVGMSLLLEPTEFVLSSGLRLVYRRLKFHTGLSQRTLGLILVFSLVATLFQLVITYFAAPWVAMLADYHARPSSLLTRVTFFTIIYLSWSVAYVWLKSEFAAREARAAAQRAELQMLRLQLNPHFMFNALNNIATQIPDQPDAALEMTHDLADFLRCSLDHRTGLVVPLKHEVETMMAYLKIEKLRFGDRLSFTVEVDPGALAVQVPCFLLQPMAENAVKHGLNSAAPPWGLEVRVQLSGEKLVIRVSNSGDLQPDWETKADIGTGVANLRRRLELHYPSRHRFELKKEGSQVSAEIALEGAPCQV